MELNKKNILRMVFILLLLVLLYSAGVPFEILIVFAIIYTAFFLVRDKLKNSIDSLLHANIPGFKKYPAWAKTAILLIVFILFYFTLKQIIYSGLSMVGLDLSEIITRALVGKYDP